MVSGAILQPAVDDHPAAWQAMVDQYRLPGEKERLLGLQASIGMSVSVCLTLLWSAVNGHGPITRGCAADLVRESGRFQTRVLGPLRTARNGLRDWSGSEAAAAAVLRESVLALELEAEALEQRLAQHLMAPVDARESAADPLGDACLSIARYVRALGSDPDAESRQALSHCIATAAADYDGLHVGQVWARAWTESR